MTDLNLFLQYLRTEKRCSPHTLKSYGIDLKQFAAYVQWEIGSEELATVSQPAIRGWLVMLAESGIGNRSIRRKISSLRSFYRYLVKEGKIEATPISGLYSPKVPQRLPVYAEELSMEQLFSGDFFQADFGGIRDRLMLIIFYETGIRLSELIALKCTDVDGMRGVLRVLGKRNKERMVPLSQELVGTIRDYMAEREARGFGSETHLVVSDRGLRLYPRFVQRRIAHYLGEVSTISKRSPHVLRHTFATHMLNNGADLNAIKEILGHANLAATQVYTHNSIEKLKQVHEQTHPRG